MIKLTWMLMIHAIINIYVLCVDSTIKCGSSLYKCGMKQTCCRGPSGWKCYNVENGICCSDGLNACPQGYTCNLRDQRCDLKPTLLFLASN